MIPANHHLTLGTLKLWRRYEATWKRELREAGPPNHVDDKVDSDQQVVNKEFSLWVTPSEFLWVTRSEW